MVHAAARPPVRHRAELSFACGDAARAALLERTLRAEATEGPPGSSVTLELEGDQVRARITGEDVATLRAAINSVARLADTALRTLG